VGVFHRIANLKIYKHVSEDAYTCIMIAKRVVHDVGYITVYTFRTSVILHFAVNFLELIEYNKTV